MSTEQYATSLTALLESSRDRDPADVIRDVYELGHAMGEATADALLEGYPWLQRHAPALTQTFYERVVRKEIAESARLLALTANGPARFTDLASPASMHTYHRVAEMFEHLPFHTCRRFVLVGCGRLPVTLFHVHERTEQTDIVGLDIVPEAVETGRALAARFGYPRVRTELCAGQTYDYGATQIVFITNMIVSKAAVLSRIADTAPPDVRVVVREPYSLRRLWSECGEASLDPRLEVIGRGEPHHTLSRNVYLKRRSAPGGA